MNTIAFVLILVAAILFLVEFMKSNWQSMLALGLCLLSVGLIAQFAAQTHTVHF